MEDSDDRIDKLENQLMKHRNESADHRKTLQKTKNFSQRREDEQHLALSAHDARFEEERRIKSEMNHRYLRWMSFCCMVISVRTREVQTNANTSIYQEREKHPQDMAQWKKEITEKLEEVQRTKSTRAHPVSTPHTEKEKEEEEQDTDDKKTTHTRERKRPHNRVKQVHGATPDPKKKRKKHRKTEC